MNVTFTSYVCNYSATYLSVYIFGVLFMLFALGYDFRLLLLFLYLQLKLKRFKTYIQQFELSENDACEEIYHLSEV